MDSANKNAPPKIPPPLYPPLSAPRRPLLGRVLGTLVIIGAGVLAGYYGYSRYRTHDQRYTFNRITQGLRQDLLRQDRKVTEDALRHLVRSYAEKSGIRIDSLTISLEPLNEYTRGKLAKIDGQGLDLAAKIGKRQDLALAGFQVEAIAHHGLVTYPFHAERYTYLDRESTSVPQDPNAQKNEQDRLRKQLDRALHPKPGTRHWRQ